MGIGVTIFRQTVLPSVGLWSNSGLDPMRENGSLASEGKAGRMG